MEGAWNLHENNQSLDLVDPTLEVFDENEAIRLIGVALLCTQASPVMRPPMSRVIAMLAGHIEVSTTTTKPSYLTDWDFKDITDSFLDGESPSSAPSNSSSPLLDNKVDNPSDPNTNAVPSPINLTETMLYEIIGEGR
ncbi:unnamed protein product [Ilex paraguariensis]|uniref:LRR receptor-like serine/threonine-protein kinase n=1 Tax=Ilex paraguariensis TaxID=185542 RepID=A0ABC8RKG2_9AQUA